MPKPLTIAVDIRDLKKAKTGTKTYLEELCREFGRMNDGGLRFRFLDTAIPVYSGNNTLLKWVEHFRYQLWKQLVLPAKAWIGRSDVLFCTDNFVPLMHWGFKTVPVFHDAFCFESPQDYGRIWLWIYYKLAVPAAKRSPFIVTPTLYAKKQINHYLNLPDEKLAVVYEGPKQMTGKPTEDRHALLEKHSLMPGNYILHVGAMYRRKNIPALIDAFKLVRQTAAPAGIKLVLAGGAPANSTDNTYREILETIKKNGLEKDVVLTGYLNDMDLAAIYKSALMYVFPSLNEGFGIPILEAFKNDLPVLVADNTCLPEVGGDAVLSFDPYDTADIAAKIVVVLNNASVREELIRKGHDRLKHFSWQITAEKLIAVFKNAATG